MRLLLLLLPLVAPVAACEPVKPAAGPDPIIPLGDVTVSFDGAPIAKLHQDGSSESVGGSAPGKGAKFTPGPRFHEDGTIELTHGNYKLRVAAGGDIFVVSPPAQNNAERLEAHLAGNQITTAANATSGVRLEGDKLVMFSDGKPTGMIGTVNPPKLATTALIMSEAFLVDLAITDP